MSVAPPIPSQAPPQTSGLAIGSMVCGILGFLTAGLTGLPAVILGHIGLSQIKKSGGALGGGGFALAGLITGYMTVLIMPIAVIAGLVTPMILRQQEKAAQVEMINNMKMIGLHLLEFDQEFGSYPSDETAEAVAKVTSGDALSLMGSDVLSQLEVTGIANPLDEMMTVHSRAEGDWTYFPGLDTTGDPRAVVLISPTLRDQAAVLHLDCSVETMPDHAAESMRMAPGAVTIPVTWK